MDSSELSDQIKAHLLAGEYAGAHYDLVHAWNEASDFGKVMCDIPELTGFWVKFKTSGYPFKLRKRWEAAANEDSIMAILFEYLTDWHIIDVDGNEVPLPDLSERKLTLLDNVEDSFVVWLIKAFTTFWRVTLLEPRKN